MRNPQSLYVPWPRDFYFARARAPARNGLSSYLFGVRELPDLLAGQSKYCPLVHRLCAKGAIEFDRRLVPIEHRPFHPAAAPITCDLRQLDKQRATVAFAALLRLNEQIFEIKSRPSEPRGKIVEIN